MRDHINYVESPSDPQANAEHPPTQRPIPLTPPAKCRTLPHTTLNPPPPPRLTPHTPTRVPPTHSPLPILRFVLIPVLRLRLEHKYTPTETLYTHGLIETHAKSVDELLIR